MRAGVNLYRWPQFHYTPKREHLILGKTDFHGHPVH